MNNKNSHSQPVNTPTTEIAIYQVNLDRDKNRVRFCNLSSLKSLQNSPEVDSRIYDKVYSCSIPLQQLKDVYRIFNLEIPKDYPGRSMSVSDVVEVRHSPTIQEGFYFCDSFQFAEIRFDPEKTVNRQETTFKQELASLSRAAHSNKAHEVSPKQKHIMER